MLAVTLDTIHFGILFRNNSKNGRQMLGMGKYDCFCFLKEVVLERKRSKQLSLSSTKKRWTLSWDEYVSIFVETSWNIVSKMSGVSLNFLFKFGLRLINLVFTIILFYEFPDDSCCTDPPHLSSLLDIPRPLHQGRCQSRSIPRNQNWFVTDSTFRLQNLNTFSNKTTA